jgi:nucleoside-diphosphate-sugar epimerase
MGFDIAAKKATMWDDGKTVFSATNEDDLGKAVAAVLQHPAETKNKFIYADSVATSQAEVLAALEKATSTKWEAEYKSSNERMDIAGEQLSKGDFTGALTTVKTTVWGNIPGLNQHFEVAEQERLMNDLLAIPRANVQEIVDRVVASAK